MNEITKGSIVKIKDKWQEVREVSNFGREYYAKLANPDKVYEVEAITLLNEVYLKGETNYLRMDLLELV